MPRLLEFLTTIGNKKSLVTRPDARHLGSNDPFGIKVQPPDHPHYHQRFGAHGHALAFAPRRGAATGPSPGLARRARKDHPHG